MSVVINSILLNADYFLLLLFRAGALFLTSPIFGRRNIPSLAKIGFMVSLGYLFFLIAPAPPVISYGSLLELFFLIAKEILVGVCLSYVTMLFFNMTYIAGQLIDMQIGFGIVNVYDPQNNSQIPMLGNILNIFMLIVFFLVNGHHRLIYTVYLTLEALPVGSVTLGAGTVLAVLEIFTNVFVTGIMVALPVIASGLILEFAFGMLMRTVPQMNMFVVGIPIKIVVGFIVITVLIAAFSAFSERVFSEMFSAVELVFASLRGS